MEIFTRICQFKSTLSKYLTYMYTKIDHPRLTKDVAIKTTPTKASIANIFSFPFTVIVCNLSNYSSSLLMQQNTASVFKCIKTQLQSSNASKHSFGLQVHQNKILSMRDWMNLQIMTQISSSGNRALLALIKAISSVIRTNWNSQCRCVLKGFFLSIVWLKEVLKFRFWTCCPSVNSGEENQINADIR